MNASWRDQQLRRAGERARYVVRRLSIGACTTLGRDAPVGRVHVINLDREAGRYHLLKNELHRVRCSSGGRLTDVTRRFAAVDARYLASPDCEQDVEVVYSLADQLFVQPDPLLVDRHDKDDRLIRMTRQEVAIAQSHIAVWRRVAEQDVAAALVLEDDTYFVRGFARRLDRLWKQVQAESRGRPEIDLIYLSYREADGVSHRARVRGDLFEPVAGIWQMSGYVLTHHGAARLLERLPVRGPVDVWINHQFANLRVIAARTPLIRQRPGVNSSNAYSVLPVLSQLGSIQREKPLLVRPRELPTPVFASGPPGSEVTALAEALALIGYRCCTSVSDAGESETQNLLRGRSACVFDAYVNVGAVGPDVWPALANARPSAKFILTTAETNPATVPLRDTLESLRPGSTLVLPVDHGDRWQLLVDFLGCQYPTYPYPSTADLPQREVRRSVPMAARLRRPARWDSSPHIIPDGTCWSGLDVGPDPRGVDLRSSNVTFIAGADPLDASEWRYRDDTFPGNLALFQPHNVTIDDTGDLALELRREPTSVRKYTSGAVASCHSYQYGRFTAELRAAKAPGAVTGVFLHRNAPRQEIDIELLGKDTTRMLVNVYFNPGCVGDRVEYGYRGTPAVVDLGFDASLDHHVYEIEWRRDEILWHVDDRVVHRRVLWDPTPVPHRPLEFNVNLWHPRSRALAGRLSDDTLPARVRVKRLAVTGDRVPSDAIPAASARLRGLQMPLG